MTHFELFHELSREFLTTIWEPRSYTLKFSSRPINVGICTLFTKHVIFTLIWHVWKASKYPEPNKRQISGCLLYDKWIWEWSRYLWSKRCQWQLWHKEIQMGHVTWDMKQGGQSTKVCGPGGLMTAKLFGARFYQVCLPSISSLKA